MAQVSLVIPSHNRRPVLARTLDALSRQTLAPSAFEVVVTLDGCTDGSAEMLAALKTDYSLKVVEKPGSGAAAARNAGARLASAPLIVFLDDDIEPAPTFLEAHLAAHAQGSEVVIGYSKPWLESQDGLFARNLLNWWETSFDAMADGEHRFDYRNLLSGNFSIGRDRFAAVGGFDESFRCREDYELGWRLIEHGARFGYAAGALGYHRDATTLRINLQRMQHEGAADVHFARTHPRALKTLAVARRPRGFRERLTRKLAFSLPSVGDRVAGFAERGLGSLERHGLHRSWSTVSHWLREYWRLRGVAAALASSEEYAELSRLAADEVVAQPPLTLELANGLAAVERSLEVTPSPAVTVAVHGRPVVDIEPLDGGEPVTRGLLRRTLRKDWAYWAAEVAYPPPPSNLGFDTPGSTASGLQLGELDAETWAIIPLSGEFTLPARLLVRYRAQPVGWVELGAPPAGVDFATWLEREVVGQASWSVVRERIAQEIRGAKPPATPPITVIICTRDRTDNLRRCLQAVETLDYPDYEILVVDNAPSDDATLRLVESLPHVRYVKETRPGLDWARNRGVAEARNAIVAFTDDDTRVDGQWLRGLARAFAQDEVMAVTGLVTPMKLDTDAQRYFEDIYGGMGKGFQPRWVRRDRLPPGGVLWSSGFGVGANMAFRRAVFDSTGPFDPALDVGTATRGGGDIEFFHRVVAMGHTLVYEPSAIVWHEHRKDWAALKRQLADNGCGFACYLLACARNATVDRGQILRFALFDWGVAWLLRRLIRPRAHQRGMVLAEIGGALKAVSAYRRARQAAEALA